MRQKALLMVNSRREEGFLYLYTLPLFIHDSTEIKFKFKMAIKVERKHDNEDINRMLTRFHRKVRDSDVLYEYLERKYYTKPSKERRDALYRAKRREERRIKHRWE